MKQLKTQASNVQDYRLGRQPIDNSGKYFKLVLEIILKNDSEVYSYNLFGDTRFTLEYLESNISGQINDAIDDFGKIEISEYTERRYLFLKIGSSDQMQVTGERIGRKK
ncbi:hypothetical protein [Acinetobacter sp. YH12140]|uniref:hypothetical protein n=1 Tax=Acinetobacter sp. YH12140 TaxID=2601124 RepID=UPI0015D16F80|nr:hypothetical protein [Acinetobacter sp. YH12140]